MKLKLPYNDVYSPFFETRKRYAVLFGGAGSGKSYATAQKKIMRCLQRRGERILIVRQVSRTCRGSTFRLLRDVIGGAGISADVNRSEMSIDFPNGSSIIHAGLDDVDKLKSIAGVTSVHIEEASQISEDAFHQVDLRLRGAVPDYRQIVLTFNPVSYRLWVKAWMETLDPKDLFVLMTTHEDNKYVDEEYARVLSGLPDENMRAIYERGEWGEDVRGLIFPEWSTTPDLPANDVDCYGLDFGFNHPNALVALHFRDSDLIADELLYESHLTTPALISRFRDIGVRRDLPMYCDSARPDQIEELQIAGFDARPAVKDVSPGIQTVRRHRVMITEASQNLESELLGYKWAEQRDGTPTDKPLKFKDDAIDALRYGAHSHVGQPDSWGLW